MEKKLLEEYNQLNKGNRIDDDFTTFIFNNSTIDDLEINEELAWQKVNSKISKDNKFAYLKIAASIVLALSATFILWTIAQTDSFVVVDISDQKQEIAFPDGSFGVVNKNSELSYAEDFANQRLVKLIGEAYFDVKKSTVPFIINANNVKVKVLGTAFNLKTEDDRINLYVERGTVAFVKDGIEYPFTKGQEAIFYIKDNKITSNQVNNTNTLAWKDGVFKFENTPFSEVAKQLERYYEVDFIISNEKTESCLVSATFDNLDISEIVSTLESILDIQIKIKKDILKVSGNGC